MRSTPRRWLCTRRQLDRLRRCRRSRLSGKTRGQPVAAAPPALLFAAVGGDRRAGRGHPRVTKHRMLVLCTHNSRAARWRRASCMRSPATRSRSPARGPRRRAFTRSRSARCARWGSTAPPTPRRPLRGSWITGDYVCTACDSANERGPVLPAHTTRVHWSFEEPSGATGADYAQLAVFRRVRDAIGERLGAWLTMLGEPAGRPPHRRPITFGNTRR